MCGGTPPSSFATVSSDTLGTTFARVAASGGDASPASRSSGTSTRSGSRSRRSRTNGLLAVTTIGGINPETLVGQRVTFLARGGPVPGAIARKRMYPEQARDRAGLEHADLHVDIGARDRDEAESLVARR